MAELRKYGVASTYKIVLVTRGSQDFLASPPLVAGDVKISIDGVLIGDINTLPTCPNGDTDLIGTLTIAELTGKEIVVTFIDQTPTKAWEDQKIVFNTYGNVLAMHQFDLNSPTVTIDQTTAIAVSPSAGTIGEALSFADAQLASSAMPSILTLLKNGVVSKSGVVNDTGATASLFKTNLSQTDTDFWKGATVVFTSGTLSGQGRQVLGYNGTTMALTVDAFSSIPTNGDAFSMVTNGVIAANISGSVWDAARVVHTNTGTFGEGIPNVINKSGYSLSSSGLDSIMVELDMNVRQALSVIAAASAGQLSGAGSGEIFIRAANDSSIIRIDSVVDPIGNRITVNLSLPT